MGAVRIGPSRSGLQATLSVPGDKSLAHRALLLGALAEGPTVVTEFPGGADVLSTLGAVRALGVRAERDGAVVRLDGQGPTLAGSGVTVDCGNSGTTMRLLAGLIAGAPGETHLDGDASLRRRPMERVAAPLRAMGATVETTAGHAPMRIRGATLSAVDWTLPVASAQVKSAVLLAGLRARGTTRVREPLPSRDHTERMLPRFGVRLEREDGALVLDGGQPLRGTTLSLPGDISSAAFFLVAASIVAGSELCLEAVGVNPTRTACLAILDRMGAAITREAMHGDTFEPRARLRVRAARLRATAIGASEVPAAIDELPILCVAAAVAEGETTIAGAGELRVKESDRLAALAQLGNLGVPVRTTADGLVIVGSGGRRFRGGRIVTGGDHRIAMAFAVAALMADEGIEIDDPQCAEVSFPGFFARLAELGATVEGA